ncbi:uncharacterized protein DNG_02202 [Cephalotrichum gorgonifer]|uniref:Uncharacterized protein n=1 Tax=Cephalotrichum gorgonifer TaxID=2041049 RepID=A0AAE8SSB9_9PEZI|nr:uncharacterized protein DNG_02202 [Cephalotrichum gorgonifer]
MDPNTPASSASAAPTADGQEYASMQKRIEELQKQHPESSDKLGSGFWVPGMQLGADINTSLDQSTRDSLNACIASVFMSKFDPSVLPAKRAEVQTILADYPDMAKTMDAMIFQNEKAWASLRDYAAKKETEDGVDVFGVSCAAEEK